MQMNSVKRKKKSGFLLKCIGGSKPTLHLDLRSVSTLCLPCVYFEFSLNLLLQIQPWGQTPSSPRNENPGFSLGLLSVGLSLIGTVSKRLIIAGITLMKNPTNN